MHKRNGFTAVELTIAMIIIAILLVIGVVSFRSSMAHSRDREREADVQAIVTFLEQIYPQEIRNSSGHLVKSAGSYPALPEDKDDSISELESIFADLDNNSMTPPKITTRRGAPSIPSGGNYIPRLGDVNSSMCNDYVMCYHRPNNITGSINSYTYAPGPADNELCTKNNASSSYAPGTEHCRSYIIVYRKEVGNERIVVESRRK